MLSNKGYNVLRLCFPCYNRFIARAFAISRTMQRKSGRFGHRLVKIWEQPEYTTKPLKVWRTGGRLPVTRQHDGEIVPGRVWNSKIGGGLDRLWYWVDHNRMTFDEVDQQINYQERIIKIIDDDNRSGRIALVAGPIKERWLLATAGMKEGDLITNCAKHIDGMSFKCGDAYPVGLIPLRTTICSLEFFPGKGSQIARSAGAYCTVDRHIDGRTIIQMPSKREINVDSRCVAVIGKVSKEEHSKTRWKNAFERRLHGLRPKKGIKVGNDGRHSRKINPPMPVVVVGDKRRLQKSVELED